jgi:chitosanase
MLRGLDVRLVQLGLSGRGIRVKADGIFSRDAARAVRDYQTVNRLPVTGSADMALIAHVIPQLPVGWSRSDAQEAH